MTQSSTRTRLAVIGGGVGLATAAVITLLVVQGDPEQEARRELARPTFVPPQLPTTVQGGPVIDAPDSKVAASTTPSAKDKAKAEAEAEAARVEAEAAKAKADVQARVAARTKARQDAIAQAKQLGILGSPQRGGAFASLTGTGDISSGFDDHNIYGGLLGTDDPKAPSGGTGYGRAGFGPGGGGTGWGAIGTGRYGTIGRGTGTGTGYGVGPRGRVAEPTVSIGQPDVRPTVPDGDGQLDRAIVRRYIKRNIQRIRYCYEKELVAKPTLRGVVQTTFTIVETGLVGTVSASGVDPAVASCVGGVIKGIEFPKPKGSGGVTVGYPFIFRASK